MIVCLLLLFLIAKHSTITNVHPSASPSVATFRGKRIFSAPNQDKSLFISVHIHIFLHLFYKCFVLSVCRSGYNRHKCKNLETYISRVLFKIKVWFFFVKIPLINDYLSHEWFVRQSVGQATNGMYVQK